jgi:uncharacterized protein YecT (DUF1311 family)
MKKLLSAMLLSCAALAAASHAQKREAKDPCEGAQTQYDMNVCTLKKFEAADALLNKVYNRLVSKLAGDEGQRAKLKAAETSWLKYRDANCDYEASAYEGGSIKPTIANTCLERMTKARAAELDGQIKELDQ